MHALIDCIPIIFDNFILLFLFMRSAVDFLSFFSLTTDATLYFLWRFWNVNSLLVLVSRRIRKDVLLITLLGKAVTLVTILCKRFLI